MLTSKVVEWNDVAALEAALKDYDVAAVLAEPVMTNIGIIHPIEGYHSALRRLTRKYGTFLILDETHTICAGPGGYSARHHLDPDFITCGKTIAGGIPAGIYGFTQEIATQFTEQLAFVGEDADVGGIGGTLAGNALSIVAMRATLEHVLTDEFFERAERLQTRFTDGVEGVIKEFRLYA